MSKYTIEFGKEVEQKLNDFAQAKDMTKAEVIRRALATYVLLKEETTKGHRVSIKDQQTNSERELLVP